MKNGERLKVLIKNSGMTQKTFAEKLDIAPTTLNGYIVSSREPDLELLVKIAMALDVSIDYLLDYKAKSQVLAVLSAEELRFVDDLRSLPQAAYEQLRGQLDYLLWSSNS